MTIKEIEIQLALGSLTNDMKLGLMILGNKRTSKKILTILSTDEYWLVRARVAGNLDTPKEVLVKLSTDEDGYVRWKAKRNFNIPRRI